MAEPATATPETTAAPATTPEPATPAAKPGRTPRAAAKAKAPAFKEAWYAHGGDEVTGTYPRDVKTAEKAPAPNDDTSTPPVETPPPADPEKTVPDNPKPPSPGEMSELEELKVRAAKLGFLLEDGKITTKDRAELRLAKKKATDEIAAKQREMLTQVEQATLTHKERIERADKILSAVDSKDHDEIAKVHGFESWDAMVEDRINRLADPNYQRLKKLEQEAKERAERDERAAKEHEERQRTQARIQAQAQYRQQLATQMKVSTNKLVQAFADDPGFIAAIFNIQQQNYDGAQVPTPEQAIRMKSQNAAESPYEYIERVYRRAKGVFEEPPPVEAAKPAPTAKPAPKTSAPPKPAPAPRGKFDTKRAGMDDAIRRFEQAVKMDEAEDRRKLA